MELTKLHKQIISCRLCREKFGFEPRPYVWGKASVKIVQISQAPSQSVHISGKPFDDSSGETLLAWYGIGKRTFYDQELFYLTSISHCYPGKTKNKTDRRPPLLCARKWLEQELEILENEIYIVVGAIAFSYFFPEQRFSDFVLRRNLKLKDKPLILLPHPSPNNRFWISKHPEFEREHIPWVREKIENILPKRHRITRQ